MKFSNAVLLSAVLLLGMSVAVAQNHGWYNGQNGQNVPYNGTNNNADYQRGFNDGINSGRADANQGKRADAENHPYFRNSNDPTYRQGFMQGYREAYGQTRGNGGGNGAYNGPYNGGYNGSNNGAYNNNAEYQRGFNDGINSGRADASSGKRANMESHPYYRNSNNQAYREGFTKGYRDAYRQANGNNGHYGHGGSRTSRTKKADET